jgi:hypothetical protein
MPPGKILSSISIFRRLVDLPVHVGFAEVELHRDGVLLEDGQVLVLVLALEGVGHHRLVLHAHQVLVPRLAQPDDGALKLPRSRVRGREGEVPRDVVFDDRGRRRVEVLLDVGQVHQPLVVLDCRLRLGPQDRDLGACGHAQPPGNVTAGAGRARQLVR